LFGRARRRVLDALPEEIIATDDDVNQLTTSGQCRLMFDGIPVDVFLNTTPFHDGLRLHVSEHQLVDRKLPFLGCNDLAVFKTFYNRRKDRADIEEILRAGWLDVPSLSGILTDYLGPDEDRIHELHTIRDDVLRSSNDQPLEGAPPQHHDTV
jgi:hypothetical protein